MVDESRRERRARIADSVDVTRVVRAIADEVPSTSAERMAESLQRRLLVPDRETLRWLLAGRSNTEIAALRGVTVRAIEKSKHRLRVVAAHVMQQCQPVRGRAFSLR